MGGLYFPRLNRTTGHGGAAPAQAPIVSPMTSIPHVSGTPGALFTEPPSSAEVAASDSDTRPVEAAVPYSLSFTPRELQVIDALQRGRSNKVIASDLKLSENTVKVHVRHIMRKLRATNRTQAALRSQLLLSTGPSIN